MKRIVVWRLLAAASVCLSFFAAFGIEKGEPTSKGRWDQRFQAQSVSGSGFTLRTPTAEQESEAAALRSRNPGLVLRWDGMSGSPRWISAPPGAALAVPGTVEPEKAARAFLQNHSRLIGLSLDELAGLELSSLVVAREGDAHIHFIQRSQGLEVFQGGAHVNFDPEKRIISIGSHLFAGVVGVNRTPALPAFEAFRIAMGDVYPEMAPPQKIRSEEAEGERRTIAEGDGFGYPPEARLVVFPLQTGARLAWEVRIAELTLKTDYRLLIDAVDGSLLFREDRTLHAAARILNAIAPDPQTEEFAPAQHVLQTIPATTPESPAGWITGNGAQLAGNNAETHLQFFPAPGLADPQGIYDYPFNTTKAALTSAWWWANNAHDRFYALGFDEGAGNFQVDNFGRGGIGGDPTRVTHFITGDRNDAFSSVGPDGYSPILALSWIDCRSCADHDGYPENGGERAAGFMREVIFHEYTHGVTLRMVGGPATTDCLHGIQSGAMGEGWADLFATSFFNDPQIGQYFFEGFGFMRDNRHDLTFSDLCKISDRAACEVHADGQIWAGTLWDLRRSMTELDPVHGLEQFHRILIKGLANTTCYPDFLDARDGILNADTMLYGSAHHAAIWNVFAKRKMGNTATSTGENDRYPVTSTSVPAEMTCTTPATPSGLTAAPDGTNAIKLSFTAPGAGAVEVYREDAGNSFDSRVLIGATTNTASYRDTTVQGGKTYRYHLVAIGNGGISCKGADSATADATANGNCTAFPIFDPGLAIADGAPTCTLTLSWNAASSGCPTASPGIVYNIYRAQYPGFEPSERLLIGRTTATTFQDEPPQENTLKGTFYYLVTAQHGTLSDPADHRSRGSDQVMKWVGKVPTLGRSNPQAWGFTAGAQGWVADNSSNPTGGWTLAGSTPSSFYAEAPFAPNSTMGGAGQSWFTGQGNSSIAANDVDGQNKLTSPSFNATGGKTIFSFDYWSHVNGRPYPAGLLLQISNGSRTVNYQDIQALTAQTFNTTTDRGWQRAEIDLATLISPTATMKVSFVTQPGYDLAEYGIDNVKIEEGTICGRSALSITDVTVDDTQPGWGNGNHKLDPGETAHLIVTLTNNGGVTAKDSSGILTSRTPGVLVHDAQDTFPTINSYGGTGTSTGNGFTITAPRNMECGSTLVFDFQITDSAGTVSFATANLEGGRSESATVFEDTFVTDKGWTNGGATPGQGVWQRGAPVPTMDGSNGANPGWDSPNDPDNFCYVTENGPSGGAANANDVDSPNGAKPWLRSPNFDLTGFKRAKVTYDLWYYDNSTSRNYWEDYGQVEIVAFAENGESVGMVNNEGEPTISWQPRSTDLNIPMVPNIFLYVTANDRDGSSCTGCQDDIVEMGIDNVKVVAAKQVCDSPTSGRPNPISSLNLTKGAQLDLAWTPPLLDSEHGAAAFFELWVAPSPNGPFRKQTTTMSHLVQDSLNPVLTYYSVVAVNSAGPSEDYSTP